VCEFKENSKNRLSILKPNILIIWSIIHQYWICKNRIGARDCRSSEILDLMQENLKVMNVCFANWLGLSENSGNIFGSVRDVEQL
jgi:hypothetical protein